MFSDVVTPKYQRVDGLDPEEPSIFEWIKRERKGQ